MINHDYIFFFKDLVFEYRRTGDSSLIQTILNKMTVEPSYGGDLQVYTQIDRLIIWIDR